MGNKINKDSYYMHIKIIGSNMQKFYEEIKNSIYLRNIVKYWEIDQLEDLNIKSLNNYFDYLNEKKENDEDKTKNLRELLILKLNNIFDSEVNILLDKMNQLSETYYFPLVLLLTVNNSNEKIIVDHEKFENIDPRLIFVANYTENQEKLEEEIYPVLLRLCSIHNELGDNFCVGEGNEAEEFDLTEKNFPFNLNMACMQSLLPGRFLFLLILIFH